MQQKSVSRKLVVNAFFSWLHGQKPCYSDAGLLKAALRAYKKELGDKEYKAQHIWLKMKAEG